MSDTARALRQELNTRAASAAAQQQANDHRQSGSSSDIALGKAHTQIAELQSTLDEERERSKELKEASVHTRKRVLNRLVLFHLGFDQYVNSLLSPPPPLLPQEIERVRSSKRAIEQRLGSSGHGVAFGDSSDEVNRLKMDAEACKKEWAIEKDALEKKIRWYMENQELLAEQEAALAELQSKNQALEDRLKHSRADEGKPLHQESALVIRFLLDSVSPLLSHVNFSNIFFKMKKKPTEQIDVQAGEKEQRLRKLKLRSKGPSSGRQQQLPQQQQLTPTVGGEKDGRGRDIVVEALRSELAAARRLAAEEERRAETRLGALRQEHETVVARLREQLQKTQVSRT